MSEHRNKVDELLDIYGDAHFSSSDVDTDRFASRIRDRAARRSRVRDVRRHGVAGLTSVLLLVLILQGTDRLVPSAWNDGAYLRKAQSSSESFRIADSVLATFNTGTYDTKVVSIFSYLDSDYSDDPVEGLAKYDDDTVDKALEDLASFSLSNATSQSGSNSGTGGSDGPMEG